MKVLVSYACELKDIPEKVAELLGNLEENDLHFVTAKLSDARSHSYDKNITEALEAIDKARIQLAKIDNSLIDYSTILAGYSKTNADIQLGNSPQENQQEDNNVNTETEEAND